MKYKFQLYYAKQTNHGPKIVDVKTMNPALRQDFTTPFNEIELRGSTDMLNLQVRDLFDRCQGISIQQKREEFKAFIRYKCKLMMNAEDPEERLNQIRNIDGLICEAIARKDLLLLEEMVESDLIKNLLRAIDQNIDESISIGTNSLKVLLRKMSDDQMEQPAFLHLIPKAMFKLMKIIKRRVFDQKFMSQSSKQVLRACITTLRILYQYIPFHICRQFTEQEILWTNNWMITLNEYKDYIPEDMLDCLLFYFYQYIYDSNRRFSYLIKHQEQFIRCLKMLMNHKKQLYGMIATVFPGDQFPTDFFKELLTFFSDVLAVEKEWIDPDEIYDETYPYVSYKEQTLNVLGLWQLNNPKAPRWILEHKELMHTLLFTYKRQDNNIKAKILMLLSKVVEEAMWVKRKDPLVQVIKEFNLPRLLVSEMFNPDPQIRNHSAGSLTIIFKKKIHPRPANNRYYKTFMSQLKQMGCPIFIFRKAMEQLTSLNSCECDKPNCLFPLLHQDIFFDELNHWMMLSERSASTNTPK